MDVTDRALYASAKGSAIHQSIAAYGPQTAIDGQEQGLSAPTSEVPLAKEGTYLAGGGGVPKFTKPWIEISLTEPIELMGLKISSSCLQLGSFPNGFLQKFHIKAGLSSTSKSNGDTSNSGIEYPVVGTYDGAPLKDCAKAYLTFKYTVKAQYIAVQGVWSTEGLFSMAEIQLLRGDSIHINNNY